jgi:hypothetical protein
MPQGYGVETATAFVAWEEVVARLSDSKHYWLATTRPDGPPHVVPRWGVWLDERFWYDGSPETLHVRNLEVDSRCTLTLESGQQVVIVEGKSLRPDAIGDDLGERLAAEYSRKYAPEYRPSPDQWSGELAGGMRYLAPEKVLAWNAFPTDLTRFRF